MQHNLVKGPMEGSPICERCGLKVMRRELERAGIIMHFCDDCYWGLSAEEASPKEVVSEAPVMRRKTA